jgi:hypothetical protein
MAHAHQHHAYRGPDDRSSGLHDTDSRTAAEPNAANPSDDVGPCICLKCGYREPARPHVACRVEICPECGARTVREGSPRHQAYLKERLPRNA